MPGIERHGPSEAWVIDASYPKHATHSVRGHHQYVGIEVRRFTYPYRSDAT